MLPIYYSGDASNMPKYTPNGVFSYKHFTLVTKY